MAIGPVQLIVIGFNHPDFHGQVIEELEKLRASDTVRVVDALAVYKDAAGEIEVMHLSNLTKEEAQELGSKIGALIGLGIDGDAGFEEGAEAGAAAAADGVQVFNDEEAWDVLEEIPNDSAAALLLIEHHWAVPLRDAIFKAGGFRISDELRLLPLLATHLSFQEIAQRLFVSRNTVKTQGISIYRKLGVSSRGDAIAAAADLGLLDASVLVAPRRFTPEG